MGLRSNGPERDAFHCQCSKNTDEDRGGEHEEDGSFSAGEEEGVGTQCDEFTVCEVDGSHDAEHHRQAKCEDGIQGPERQEVDEVLDESSHSGAFVVESR